MRLNSFPYKYTHFRKAKDVDVDTNWPNNTNNLFTTYLRFLPGCVLTSTFIGATLGGAICYSGHLYEVNEIAGKELWIMLFSGVYGFVTGITYPISYPYIGYSFYTYLTYLHNKYSIN